MAGFPYYNDDSINDEIYLSDIVTDNGKFFIYSFMLAIITTPFVAFAEDVCVPAAPGPKPANVPAPSPNSVPTAVRNTVQAVVGVTGCGAALKKCGDVVQQGVKASTDKLSTVNPSTAVAIGGCLLLAGYCAGKLTTKAIDKALGF